MRSARRPTARRDRGGGRAPCRHQGRLSPTLGPEIASRAGRQLRQHRVGEPCLYPIVDGDQHRHDDAGGRELDLQRQRCNCVGRHQLRRAAGRRHGGADAVGPAGAGAGATCAACCRPRARPFPTTGADNGDGTPVPVCQAPNGGDQLRVLLHHDHLRRRHARRGCGRAGARRASSSRTSASRRRRRWPVRRIELSAAASVVAIGRTVARVHWVITDGGGIVDGFSDGADAMTASVVPTAAGRFSVSVTVTETRAAVPPHEHAVIASQRAGGGGGGAGACPAGWPGDRRGRGGRSHAGGAALVAGPRNARRWRQGRSRGAVDARFAQGRRPWPSG